MNGRVTQQFDMSPYFYAVSGQNNGETTSVAFHWPENTIDWPEPA